MITKQTDCTHSKNGNVKILDLPGGRFGLTEKM